jgi:hypothetical protein
MSFQRCLRLFAQCTLAIGLAASPAAAQSGAANSDEQRAPVDDRFNVGFRIGAPLTSLVKGVSSVESTSATDPPTTTSTEVSGQGTRLVAGPTFEYAVNNDFTIGADFLYRRAGYDSAVTLAYQVTDDTDGDIVYQEFQETRLNYFDLPLIVRYFPGKLDPAGARPYVLGGVALRFAGGVSTTTEFVDSEGVVDTDKTPIDLNQSAAFGGMIGAGLRLVDDVGIKIDLEARLTRWGQNTIQTGPANSNANQIEFLFGITF